MHVGHLWDIVRDEIPPSGGGLPAWVADKNPAIDGYITNYFRLNCKQGFRLKKRNKSWPLNQRTIHHGLARIVLDLCR